MRFDYTTGKVYVRQSWLNDLIICPERARFKLAKPDMSGPSDATIMGTAVHSGIERILGGSTTLQGIKQAHDEFEKLHAEPFKVTGIPSVKYGTLIDSMMQAFIDGILPEVVEGGKIEHKFSYPIGYSIGDWAVWCEGTMDYIDPNGVIWDWKTASRPYYLKEKQSQSIQATVYAAAAVKEFETAYPVDFRYGVMVRQETPKSQIGYMVRTAEHHRWLMHTTRPAVVTALRMGIDSGTWIMNDTSALCSEKWCPYWSVCKGAFISPEGLSLPIQAPLKQDKDGTSE